MEGIEGTGWGYIVLAVASGGLVGILLGVLITVMLYSIWKLQQAPGITEEALQDVYEAMETISNCILNEGWEENKLDGRFFSRKTH